MKAYGNQYPRLFFHFFGMWREKRVKTGLYTNHSLKTKVIVTSWSETMKTPKLRNLLSVFRNTL